MTAQHLQPTLAGTELLAPGRDGTVRVLGGPGTGKSTLLINTAVDHITAGTDPESVLLLTGSARMGADARAAITARLLGAGTHGVVREPLVRTVHSYAFAVLRLAAQRNGDPPPRLITTAEQDGIIRELLAGDLEDGVNSPVGWPEQLWPALSTAGFATELRDLLARCTERGVDPRALQRLGRSAGRPEWLAAGRFAQAYEQIMLLRSAVGMAAPQATVPALGAAELVGAALDALGTDADLLAAERARISLLLVDDAQHLDPQAALLVRVLAARVGLTVIAGDPDQSVFGYRGADPALLRDHSDATPAITLSQSYRCAPAVAAAISGIARRLPGVGPARVLEGNPERGQGEVTLRMAATPHAENAFIADALRRAHLVDGVPWSQMAVVVRSIPRVGAALARALSSAGVPVQATGPDLGLAQQPAVAALLTVLEATASGRLDGDSAISLLTGPIGRVDPVTLRQLRRALRRVDGSTPPRDFTDLLVAAIDSEPAGLSAEHAKPLRRLRSVLAAARRSQRDGADPRYTLWQAWNACRLQPRWLAASERGGTIGAQADRDLDAVTALFDVADQYVSRTAGATLRGLVDHVVTLGTSMSASEASRQTEAVAVLSAHAALGREWDFVVIAGVQEGLWPNTVPRGGILGTQRLVDVLDGVAAPDDRAVSTRAPLLAEERRLLMAAMGRARTRLLVTAVDSDGGDESLLPSLFCAELAEVATEYVPLPPLAAPRVLLPSAVVGRLRAVVCAPEGAVDDESRSCAATQLARLAAAGVPGADPAQWHTMTSLSTEEPLWSDPEHVVTLSPSTLQMLTDCPLRWLLERHGGSDGRDVRSTVGSLLHALVSDSGKTEGQLINDLEKVWEDLPFEAKWYSDNELSRHREMLETFTRWRTDSRTQLTEIATEIDVDGVIVEPGPDGPGVQVRGRLDRLERDQAGRLVVVDLKTGKSPVTKDDAQKHAQLATYQLAVAAGLLPHGDEPGGGRLVYLGKAGAAGATEREQDPMTPDTRTDWLGTVAAAAAATAGPQFAARVNDGCANCPVRSSCPAQAVGERP
ncbi:ATP-dependent DNA helicase [Mycolicibacterium conceptionense]|uniref:DNA 3'-5' helicase n=2 Tax=Mycolicibacterium TaxID=1866885 RepID=A0A1A1Y074_9MYCO|nr:MULTISPECIES: ATP-dependent DNA helicase [Mycolicibacterium]MCW1819521.1 ATP-dependent helicase [Mycolicibacterium senegalense]OBB08485.1 ATP-dependent DNA helicase [Mycolicibacterium conceptionense]OBE92146.1 ATP-dependent DNA helicase [Mycolicibacterium conceptionense]OBF24636.1 ATP-dependent DNA helicase [Mycolicibacterium conceptionense]OBF45170.1 ATP-dependent DNA helicase [Mycolicibacterium conceptionense]